MALAMSGLTFVQVQLLRNAWQQKEQAFERNAMAALSLTIQQLESGDIHKEALTILSKGMPVDFGEAEIFIRKFSTDSIFPERLPPVQFDRLLHSNQSLSVFLAGDRQEMIQQVVGELMVHSPAPFTDRINKAQLDSLLSLNLKSVGINMKPHFAVVSDSNDSLLLANVLPVEFPGSSAPYQARLFPLDFLPPAFNLVLWFPGRTEFLWAQILPLALASLVFMVVVLISFWLNLRMISEQKRASESMVDFINNMTHEFKTPISTVHLASEAIAGQEFKSCPDSLQRYNEMIRQETRRMSSHTERILQFAYLEDGVFELNNETVTMHQVIKDSCAAFLLVVGGKEGRLTLNLSAKPSTILGDSAHLANIVTNLVDNAIKYSPESPQVDVKTRNEAGWFILEVSDKGKGITQEDQGRVFERYFRCHTGNRHDVKGFGLGLSYVQLLVDAHMGTIEMESRLDVGTTIRILLPQEPNND